MEWAGWVVEQLGGLGAALIRYVLLFAWFCGAIAFGAKVNEWRQSRWQGWLVGILAALLFGAMTFPAIEALKRIECKGASDFQACLDDDDGGDD